MVLEVIELDASSKGQVKWSASRWNDITECKR